MLYVGKGRGVDAVKLSKKERLEIFKERLMSRSPCSTRDEAWELVDELITEVEEEFSDVQLDGNAASSYAARDRMYPPHLNFQVPSGSASILTTSQRGHRTSFGTNGSIEIVFANGTTWLEKRGDDGLTVDDLRDDDESNSGT